MCVFGKQMSSYHRTFVKISNSVLLLVWVCVHAYVHVCVRTRACTCICLCVQTCVCVCVSAQHVDELMPRKSRSRCPPPACGSRVSPVSVDLVYFRLAGPQASWTRLMSQPAISPPECGNYRQTRPHPLFTWSPGIELKPSDFQGKHFNQVSHLARTWCY